MKAITKAIKWESPLSDKKELYFDRLLDHENQLIFTVKDEDDSLHDIIIVNSGPYMALDEAYLGGVWESESKLGWTVELEESELLEKYNSEMWTWVQNTKFRHFVIVTFDLSLMVLSAKVPEIRTQKNAS